MNGRTIFLMVGLPASGKSTYLGALFHMLARAPRDSLHLARDPEERDYLLELERKWLSLTPLERSRHHGAKNVEIPIGAGGREDEFLLAIPDVVGEDYEDAWLHGDWREDLPEWIVATDGLLLFVRADNVREATLISVEPPRNLSARTDVTRWDPNASPTQAMLCDLLEQISETRGGTVPPVAVVVSAWDSAAELDLTPEAWVDWQTPLLSQWLRANEPDVPFGIFGISAQGGDLRNEDVRQQLANRVEDRPLPKHGSPLTGPLEWLLERDQA